jgi:hypothetical protein
MVIDPWGTRSHMNAIPGGSRTTFRSEGQPGSGGHWVKSSRWVRYLRFLFPQPYAFVDFHRRFSFFKSLSVGPAMAPIRANPSAASKAGDEKARVPARIKGTKFEIPALREFLQLRADRRSHDLGR